MNPALERAIATFAAGYARRLLSQKVYDKGFASETGRQLMALNSRAKHGIEFVLNALTASLDQLPVSHSPTGHFFRDVLADLPSEVSKRLLNNVPGSHPSGSLESVPEVGAHGAEEDGSGPEQHAIGALLDLDPDAMRVLLPWLLAANSEQRRQMQEFAASLTEEQLDRFARLEDSEKSLLLEIARQTGPPEEAPALRIINQRLRKWLKQEPSGEPSDDQ